MDLPRACAVATQSHACRPSARALRARFFIDVGQERALLRAQTYAKRVLARVRALSSAQLLQLRERLDFR